MITAKACWFSCLWFLGAAPFILPAQSAPTVFTLDNSQSQIVISGDMAGFPITPQGAGSLTNSYSGSLNTDQVGTNLQFTGGSTLGTQNNGVWQPAVNGASGSAGADYGAKASVNYPPFGSITVYGALRNIEFDISSPVLPVSGGGFNGASLVFSFASSNAALDYRSSLFSGSVAGTGYATNSVASGSTLSVNGSTQTLVIPIDATFYFKLLSANDTAIHLTGQLVATHLVAAAPPVINSISVHQQTIIITVQNATILSQVLVSSNLTL